MYILKNSIKDLFKNKIYNLINIIIIISMISSIGIFIIIKSSTNTAMSNYKNKLQSEVKINKKVSMKYSESEKISKGEDISTNDYLNFAESKYVKKASFIGDMMAYIEGLSDDNNKYSSDTYERNANIAVTGYSDYENLLQLTDIKIEDGNIFKDNNECMISKRVMESTGLKIGDEVSLVSGIKGEDDKILKLKIVGIYEYKYSDIYRENIYIESYSTTLPGNGILTTYNTLVNFEREVNSRLISTTAKFLLNDSNSLKSFEMDLRGKGLSNMYTVGTDEEAYRNAVLYVKKINSFIFTIMFGVLSVGSILLILNSIISLKKIKYKIGVLRLIGISKLKIVKGFLYESIIMTIICLGVGLFIASAVAKPVANNVFEEKDKNSVAYPINSENKLVYININQINLKEELKDLKVNFRLDYALIIIVAITIITSGVSIYNTIIYNPMQVINNRE